MSFEAAAEKGRLVHWNVVVAVVATVAAAAGFAVDFAVDDMIVVMMGNLTPWKMM